VSLTELHLLKTAWEAAFPRQATGGERAVAGFHYQFLQVLLETVRGWLTLAPDRRGMPTVLAEWLSDIVNATDPDVIVVTQVKYTQGSGMVATALGDLWRIHQVALRATPDLFPRLRFRILSARASLKDVEGAIRRWPAEDAAENDQALNDFRSRLQVDLQSDPEDDLLALLANEFRAERPLATVQAWLGRLLEAADGADSYERAARDIWEDLYELDRQQVSRRATGVHVWTSQDRPPVGIREGRCLIGEQPLTSHLRDGFFDPRPSVFKPLADRAEAWIIQNPTVCDESHRLQLFWIGGRSGSGKSVALLHVLTLLHERGHGPILWLGNKVGNLPASIRWARELRRPGQPVLIGIDDPYTPALQGDAAAIWQEALAELQESRESGDASSLPMIVCCGPTEQAERLQDEWSDDLLVVIEMLGRESSADIAELRAWYRARTGQEPPQVSDENILLVQLFFQWRVGVPLAEFARRFRRRINAADRGGGVERALARMLALNRLYVGYSQEAFGNSLTAKQRDLVARLRREEHLAEDQSNSRPGLWLAHPHLADAIYETWYPALSSENVRQEHLRAGILDALQSGASPAQQTAPLWALSRVFVGTAGATELARRVGGTNVQPLLEEIYQQFSRNGSSMSLAHLPVWIQIRVLVNGVALTPDPVQEATKRIGGADLSETGLRLTCHKLLEHVTALDEVQGKSVIDAVLGLLERSLKWREWPHIAGDMAARTNEERLWPLIAKWFATHSWLRSAQHLFLVALNRAPASLELLRAARAGLITASASEEWFRIATHLLKTEGQGLQPDHVLAWAAAKRLDRSAVSLIREMLIQKLPQGERWALEWAARWHRERNASFVLESLCSALPSDPRVSAWSRSWIEERFANSGFLMEQLLHASPQDSDTRALGKAWLQWTPSSHGSWIFVWNALWDSKPGDAEVERLGYSWLAESPLEHGSWAFMWQVLWNARVVERDLQPVMPPELSNTSSDQRLITQGMRFLAIRPPLRSFAFVWLSLWHYRIETETLTVIAEHFLAAAEPDHPRRAEIERALGIACGFTDPEWAPAWARRYEKEVSREGAVSIATADEGLNLLRSSYDHEYWASVFLRLWQTGLVRDQLKPLGYEWLTRNPTGRRAKEVCLTLGLEELTPVPTPLEVGSRVEGIVSNMVDYGIFISLGEMHGLLHVSKLPDAHAADLYSFYSIGQRLQLVVTSIDARRGHISLALEKSVIDVWPQQAIEKLRAGEDREGTIVKTLRQGIYVEMGDIIGFVPTAHLPGDSPPIESFRKGQVVRVKVLSIDEQHQRIVLALLDSTAALS
jgi:predicted RNA-binding protein with RPS1 domain